MYASVSPMQQCMLLSLCIVTRQCQACPEGCGACCVERIVCCNRRNAPCGMDTLYLGVTWTGVAPSMQSAPLRV
jgi:hypothetical protein